MGGLGKRKKRNVIVISNIKKKTLKNDSHHKIIN